MIAFLLCHLVRGAGSDSRGFPHVVGTSAWFPSGTATIVPEGGILRGLYCRFSQGTGVVNMAETQVLHIEH